MSTESPVAVVTGASRGIGLATTRALRAAGFRVAGAARTVTDELRDAADLAVAADLTTPGDAEALVATTREQLGPVDVLVNNVGAFTARTDGFAAITDADWQQAVEVNLMTAVRTIRAALDDLLATGGAIVNVSSITARDPMPPVADYAAAKAALTSLSTSLAEELGPQGVRVNTVSPGPTLTSAWTDADGFGADLARASGVEHDAFLEGFAADAGLSTGRLTEPEEVAEVIVLLASGKVRNLHGADLAVDGGQHKAA